MNGFSLQSNRTLGNDKDVENCFVCVTRTKYMVKFLFIFINIGYY